MFFEEIVNKILHFGQEQSTDGTTAQNSIKVCNITTHF